MEESGILEGHTGCVNTVTATPDGQWWITGSDDTKIMVWDAESHKRVKSFLSGHTNNVLQARALPFTSNDKIVSCASDGQIRLATLSASKSAHLGTHRGRAHRLTLEPGSPNTFLSCGEDGVVLSFDLRSPRYGRQVLVDQVEAINSITLRPMDPHFLFVCGSSPYLDMWDRRKASEPAASLCPEGYRKSRNHITGCALNWCGKEALATYNPTGVVYRFHVDKNSFQRDMRERPPARSAMRRRIRQAGQHEMRNTFKKRFMIYLVDYLQTLQSGYCNQ
ncbi:unnamed protein product [Discosporangium mesarthrocarpum]